MYKCLHWWVWTSYWLFVPYWSDKVWRDFKSCLWWLKLKLVGFHVIIIISLLCNIFTNIAKTMLTGVHITMACYNVHASARSVSLSTWKSFASLTIQNFPSEDSYTLYDWTNRQIDLNLCWACLNVCFLSLWVLIREPCIHHNLFITLLLGSIE